MKSLYSIVDDAKEDPITMSRNLLAAEADTACTSGVIAS